MEVQKASKIKLFLESNKTTESCSRPHAELVLEVWRAPKPNFFQDHFRKPSSCCTGAVVSQTFVENGTPESVQNPSKILLKMKQETRWKNNVFCAGRSQRPQNGAPKTIPNQAFSEPAKTTESCSRLHAELVFEVWRAPKPHFFQDHFRKPSSCCTGAVVSQIIAENDAPESVQNG